jgi:hypothetical protein
MIDRLLQIFARSILAKVDALRGRELKPNQRKRLRKSIIEDIRTCGGLIYPDEVLLAVSKAAQQEADRLGVNISGKTWHDQPTFDPGRKKFHLEHVYAVSAIQKECERAQTEEAILSVLKTRLRIAWILKREDEKLNRLHFRSVRPDPDAAYRAAGIELVEPARM